MRNTTEKRHNDWQKAIRKRRIVKEVYCWDDEWYDNLHQYSKNKVHCSCGICARYRKTNNHGHRRQISGNYAPSKNWSIKDQRRLEDMTEQLEESAQEGDTYNNYE